jgi:hypothetical protein
LKPAKLFAGTPKPDHTKQRSVNPFLLKGKTMRKIIRTVVLGIALAFSTYAGEIQNPIDSYSPSTTATQGEIPNNLTETALTILGALLSLI